MYNATYGRKEKIIKIAYIICITFSFICIPSFAYGIEKGNHTKIQEETIQELVDNLTDAIKIQDREAISILFHSSCTSLSSEQQKDFDLFIRYLLDQHIEDNFEWKAIPITSYKGYIFKINRFPINPEINIDLFKKYPEKRNGKKYWSLSLWATQEQNTLKLVYYMSDYMAKEINGGK